MIPVKLCLEDFLSYAGPVTIDMSAFEVACLTGSNGQGKSALLDAMTWALFGAARGCESGQNQERLIREEADKARVELVFELGADTYRIARMRSRKGRSDLQFDIRSDSGWTTLAGDTSTQTQSRICDVVRLDYRTFTASAFLLQGRADDFLTRMKPEDRKDVFARLLDLGVYERLNDEARTRARDCDRARKLHADRIEELRDTDAHLSDARQQLQAAQVQVLACTAEAEEADKELEARRAELGRIEKTEAVAEGLRRAVFDLKARLETDRSRLEARRDEVATLDGLLARAPEVAQALEEAEGLRKQEEKLRASADRRSSLDLRRTEIEGRIAAERKVLEATAAKQAEQATALAREIVMLAQIKPQLDEVDEKLARVGSLRSELSDVRTQLADLREEHGQLAATAKTLSLRQDDVAERLQILARGTGECPVCAGPLDEPHLSQLVGDLNKQSNEIVAEINRTAARREVVTKEGRRLGEEEKRLAGQESELQDLAAKASALRDRLSRLPELREQETGLRTELESLQVRLASGAPSAELSRELDEVTKALDSEPYDPAAHERVRVRLSELAPYAGLQGRIHEARARRDAVGAELVALADAIAAEERDLKGRERDLSELADALSDAPAVRARVEQAKITTGNAREKLAAAGQLSAQLSERVRGLDKKAEELSAARAAELEAAVQHRRWTRLATAFGRGGIPDLIIENALPELTQEANDILGRLSDWNMGLQFVMNRETKSGKVKETFDVLVHHDGGVRDFAMFSGGEAFRIAFSIRMALSKILLRRAGARMETLVIDEGFGTQDPEGREKLIEAINLARKEFRKVLVITHLDELKEAFGTQVRVWKDPALGSRAEVAGG